MTNEQKQQVSEQLQTGLLLLWGITFLIFPLGVSTFTTDAFILPKELLLATIVLISLLVWGIQMLLSSQVRIRRTPLDIPILLFTVSVMLSALFSVNRTDSIITSVGIVFIALSYFVLVNVFKTRKVGLFFLSSLVTGGVLATLITIFAHYNIYLLPFTSTRVSTFTPFGTYTEYELFTLMLLPLTFTFIASLVKKQLTPRFAVFTIGSIILAAGVTLIGGLLATTQKPTLLPFDTGFQTAFAAISQDSGRVLQTFFFGEGYGNFATVFSRFHNSAFNANQQLWPLSFSNSSSYLLEILATTGLIGCLSFLFLAYKTLFPLNKKITNPFYVSLIVAFVFSAVLPFSFIEVTLLFFLLAGFSVTQRDQRPQEYFDIELQFVALKKGVFSFTTLDSIENGRSDKHATPFVACIVIFLLVAGLGYYTTMYAASDILFQKSLVAANKNNGTQTYQLQTQSISIFPYRSDYYRIFSQTNIAVTNSLLALQSGKSPTTTVQQTALTLIQQAITTAKQATTLAPQSVAAWQNLSSVYRSLIGVGQNAQDFAITSAQQSAALDSANPQEYLNLGGLYYQLGQYDNAIRMFQQAITLKNDYANAYYNLGHSYEQKGDLQNALTQYQTVQTLLANDKPNEEKITNEITALQAKIGKTGSQPSATTPTTGTTQQPLSLPTTNQLPAQTQQVPLVSPTPHQ